MTRFNRAVLLAGNLLTMTVFGTMAGAQSAAGFTPLFDGTLAGWSTEHTGAGSFEIVDGVLRVGGPGGWLRSDSEYTDFRLRVEFRFLSEDADSGIYVRAANNDEFVRGWPNGSYQIQLRNPLGQSPFPPVGGIFRHAMPAGETTFDAAVAGEASTGTGNWQVLDIEVAGESLAVHLNGVRLTAAGSIVHRAGYVGIQGEAGQLEFRSLLIAPLSAE